MINFIIRFLFCNLFICVITGLFRPCIYLPVHLISDYQANAIRYMLLHELQHYKHKDALANYLMNAASILYWFNPFDWYALKEMRNDRKIACDSSVLKMLDETAVFLLCFVPVLSIQAADQDRYYFNEKNKKIS